MISKTCAMASVRRLLDEPTPDFITRRFELKPQQKNKKMGLREVEPGGRRFGVDIYK